MLPRFYGDETELNENSLSLMYGGESLRTHVIKFNRKIYFSKDKRNTEKKKSNEKQANVESMISCYVSTDV